MTLETFAIIICSVLCIGSYIGIKYLEKNTYSNHYKKKAYIKYKGQKAWCQTERGVDFGQ